MDEPTNDLDLETLELLEDLLSAYAGTLLLVSHDREFLNNVVTSTLVLEGEGRVKEYAGGYDDWLRQRPEEQPPVAKPPTARSEPMRSPAPRTRRLTYKEQRELEALPERIAALEAELGELHQRAADPAFYRKAPAEIISVNSRLQSLQDDVAKAYGRWEELELIGTQKG
jgi:ATP-binding cassette subfamily F protein uup